ncbi:GDSL esterase/lipase At5g45960 [Humulus lupulus]|uniref:GDSL esterase/lipase At5g45960 n=1 Tax=Humulus lupulus TaxID=3486 RepID=UPI002B413638|nr:GDSL esterase/lipase At5g45960 [Humulus lupulus]
MVNYLINNKHLQLLETLLLIFVQNPSTTIRFISQAQALNNPNGGPTTAASAVLVFGDSTVDPGNNNYVSTLFKSNFPPYGRDFAGKKPTGRFSNGRLTTDFLASYVGLKDYVPPYLDPSLSTEELMTGVSFASAGSGYDPLTPKVGNVIPMLKQLEYFKEYKKRLESTIGKERTENHINKAIFVISAGTNDFIVNYFNIPVRRKIYTTVSSYEMFLMEHVKTFLQDLWGEGARRIIVGGIPPMGCLPGVITLNSPNEIQPRGCIDKYSSVARDYNKLLQNELHSMQSSLAIFGARIAYVDLYGPLMNLIQGHTKFGLEELYKGCCGTGYLEVTFLCNPLSYVCPDANKYMFWDSIHPTEKTYNYVFNTLIHPILDFLLKP